MMPANKEKAEVPEKRVYIGRSPVTFHSTEKPGEIRVDVVLDPLSTATAEEQFKSALKQITGTKNSEIAKEIIYKAVEAMPDNAPLHDRHNVVIQTLSEAAP